MSSSTPTLTKEELTPRRLSEALLAAERQLSRTIKNSGGSTRVRAREFAALRDRLREVIYSICFLATRFMREHYTDCKGAETWHTKETFRRLSAKGFISRHECVEWISWCNTVGQPGSVTSGKQPMLSVSDAEDMLEGAERLKLMLERELAEDPVLNWRSPDTDSASLQTMLENKAADLRGMLEHSQNGENPYKYGALWTCNALLQGAARLVGMGPDFQRRPNCDLGAALPTSLVEELRFQVSLRKCLSHGVHSKDDILLSCAPELLEAIDELVEYGAGNTAASHIELHWVDGQGKQMEGLAVRIGVDVADLWLIYNTAKQLIPEFLVAAFRDERDNEKGSPAVCVRLGAFKETNWTTTRTWDKKDWKKIVSFRQSLEESDIPFMVLVEPWAREVWGDELVNYIEPLYSF